MNFLTEPEPMRGPKLPAGPGIARIVAPNPGVMTYWGTNTYVIDTPDGAVIVDPGPDDAQHVEATLREAGPRIAAILLTHTHHDHIGALPALRAATRAPVAAFHAPADPSVTPDIPLRDGDRIGSWQAIHTPGHAADHLCFLAQNGTMLSGDHVMSWSTTVVSPPGGSMADYFRSLERLLDTDAALYLPGHGPPLGSPRSFVAGLLAHRRQREAAILAIIGAEPTGVREIAAALYPQIDGPLRRAAERSVTAHLEKLLSEGAAARSELGWAAAS